MLIYRFEDDHQKGPWRSIKGCAVHTYRNAHRCHDKYHCAGNMASPSSEGGELYQHYRNYGIEGWHFAFVSKAQLKRAFPSGRGRQAMKDQCNVNVVVLEVDPTHVMKGEQQCIFARDKATIVGYLDPKTLKEASA